MNDSKTIPCYTCSYCRKTVGLDIENRNYLHKLQCGILCIFLLLFCCYCMLKLKIYIPGHFSFHPYSLLYATTCFVSVYCFHKLNDFEVKSQYYHLLSLDIFINHWEYLKLSITTGLLQQRKNPNYNILHKYFDTVE